MNEISWTILGNSGLELYVSVYYSHILSYRDFSVKSTSFLVVLSLICLFFRVLYGKRRLLFKKRNDGVFTPIVVI